jgi:hypothetical protein
MTEKQKMAIAEVLELKMPSETALTIIEGIMDNESQSYIYPSTFPWVTYKDSTGYSIDITTKQTNRTC